MAFLVKRVGVTPGGFGEALSELRELRGYTRIDVSRATGIHVSLVTTFEEERLEDLVDPAYDERHVKALAEFLEERPAYLLEKYRALMQARGIGKNDTKQLRPRIRRRDLFVVSRMVAFVGFISIAVFLGGYVVWYAWGLSSPPRLEILAPAQDARLDAPLVEVSGVTDPSANVRINGQTAVVDSSGTFHYTLHVPRGLTTITIEARRRYGSLTSVERHVIYER